MFSKVPIILNKMFIFLQCKILNVRPCKIVSFARTLCKCRFLLLVLFLHFLLAAFSMSRNKAQQDSRLSAFIIISSAYIHNKSIALTINAYVLDFAHPQAAHQWAAHLTQILINPTSFSNDSNKRRHAHPIYLNSE